MAATTNPKNSKLLAFSTGFLVLVAAVALVLWLVDSRTGNVEKLSGSAKAVDRMEAVDKAGKSSSGGASKALEKLSRDRDENVAVRAIWALGDSPGDRNRDALRRIVTDKSVRPRVRGEAAAALGKHEDAGSAILKDTLVGDGDPQVRAGAAKGLSRVAGRQKTVEGAKSIIPQLSRALEDPDPNVRAWAITAIHKLIVRRFQYSATASPETQQEQIEAIRKYLRGRGVL
jgi:HEAT repeat protein